MILLALSPAGLISFLPGSQAATEQPSGTHVANTADATTGLVGNDTSAGVSSATYADDSGASESTDNATDLWDTVASGYSAGSQSTHSGLQGTADTVPTSGTVGTQTTTSASGPNSSADVLSLSGGGAQSITSAATSFEAVPDTLPSSTPVGSATNTSTSGANSQPDVLGSGSAGSQTDDSDVQEGGDPASPLNDTKDQGTGGIELDTQLNEHVKFNSAATSVTNNTLFTVNTTFYGGSSASTTTCNWWTYGLNNNTGTWESVSNTTSPSSQVWKYYATPARWELDNGALPGGTNWRTTDVTIQDTHANGKYHHQFLLLQRCTDPENQPAGDIIRVGIRLNRTEWITHTGEIGSLPTSTGQSTISGTFRILVDADLPFSETFDAVRVHLDQLNATSSAWTNDVDNQSLAPVTIAKDGDGAPDNSSLVAFTLGASPTGYTSQYRVWAEFTELTNNRNNVSENGNVVKTSYAYIDRKEWITHTGTLSGVYVEAQGSTGQVLTPVTFNVSADIAQPLDQTFTATLNVWAQRLDDSFAMNVTTNTTTVTIPQGAFRSSDWTLNAVLPADRTYKGYRLYVRFTETASLLNSVAEDGVAAETGRLNLTRREWITHQLNMTVESQTANPYVNATLKFYLDQSAPQAESYRFTARLWAYNLSTNVWDGPLANVTEANAITLSANANESNSVTIQLNVTQSIYYSKYKIQGNASEPTTDKNGLAENGTNIFTGEVNVTRREWITHRAHMSGAAAEASDGVSLTATVWVETDADLTLRQDYNVTRVLDVHSTNNNTWWSYNTTSGLGFVTIVGTTASAGETTSNTTVLTWPALPGDANFDLYRLQWSFVEPTANSDNSVADSTDSITAYAQVTRSEWVNETLNVTVAQSADPGTALSIGVKVLSNLDLDSSRTYWINLTGTTYNGTSADWRVTYTDNFNLTFNATAGSDTDTASTTWSRTWTLPKSGYDSKYSLNVSFVEANPTPGETGLVRTVPTNTTQSTLNFATGQGPTIKRVRDNSGTSRYFWPLDTVVVFSEINYTYGADYNDYGTVTENVRYTFRDAEGTSQNVTTTAINSVGFSSASWQLPSNAAYGVWTVEVYYPHDSDTLNDTTTATFVVRPLILSLKTKRLGNATADVYASNITVETAFNNSNMASPTTDLTYNGTIRFPNDDSGNTAIVKDTNPSVDASLDNATFTLTLPQTAQGGDATIQVTFQANVTWQGSTVQLTAQTGDGNSTEDALVHIIASEQPTRNFYSLTHDATTGQNTGTNTAAQANSTTSTDTSAASESTDNETDLYDTLPTGLLGSQAAHSGSQGMADTLAASGEVGSQTATSASGTGASPDLLPTGSSGSQTDGSNAQEAGDPADPYNDNADDANALDTANQTAYIKSAPTVITVNESFTVTTNISAFASATPADFRCDFTIRGFNRQSSAWETVPGNTWTSDNWTWKLNVPGPSYWINKDQGTNEQWINNTVTIGDTMGTNKYHNKYAIVYDCADSDNAPTGDRIRVTVVVERNEWIAHTLTLPSLPTATANPYLNVTAQLSLNAATPIAETYNVTVRLFGFNLQTSTWDNLNTTYFSITVASTAASGTSSALQFNWSQSIYYSKFRINASTTEPNADKNSVADNGTFLQTNETVVLRREWITHRIQLLGAPTNSSDGQTPTVEVWVDTDTDLTLRQDYNLTRVLDVHTTNNDTWWTYALDVTGNFLTILGTTGASGEVNSNHTNLTWAALPSNADIDLYRLRVNFTEPAATGDNSVADNGDTLSAYVEAGRREWVNETLELTLPASADPAAAVSIQMRVLTNVDLDAARTYWINLTGHAYNASSGQWRQILTDAFNLTFNATAGSTTDTASTTWSRSWTLPQSGYDSKYSLNMSYQEGRAYPNAVETDFLRASKNFDQSALAWTQVPKVLRVEQNSGPARYYFPAENVTVWSEVQYELGADYDDYGTVQENVTFEFFDSLGTIQITKSQAVDVKGYATATATLPSTAAFGVWTVRTTYTHDADTIQDNTSATLVVKPVITSLTTKLSGVSEVNFTSSQTLTVEASFVNLINSTGSTFNATLVYDNSTFASTNSSQLSPSVSGQVATFNFTTPTDAAEGSRDARIHVNLTHQATYKSQTITIATETRDNISTVDALVHLSGQAASATIDFVFVSGQNTVTVSDLSPAATGDWFIDSLESTESKIQVNASTSNRNIVVYVDATNFNITAKARGQQNALSLANLDYQTVLSPTPDAGIWKDGTVYRAWSATNADYPGTWIFFADGNESGAVRDGPFSSADNAGPSTANNATKFSPAILSTKSGATPSLHKVTDITTLPSSSNLQWSNGNAPSSSDVAFEVAVPYYLETATGGSSGTAGTLESRYVEVLLRSDGSEVAVRQGGTSQLGANWDQSGWDRAKTPDGNLGSESLDNNKAKNVVVTLFDNRYVVYGTSTTSGSESVVLAQAVLLPKSSPAASGKFYAAVAFPKEAPSGDYAWSFTLKGVNWGARDSSTASPDEVQYP